MNFLIPILAVFMVSAAVHVGSVVPDVEAHRKIVDVRVSPLKLEKPDFEWKRCTCPNGTEMGLTENDFIVFQMYLQGLEHEAQKTCGDDFYSPPATKFVDVQ